jgi:hypothetical protein
MEFCDLETDLEWQHVHKVGEVPRQCLSKVVSARPVLLRVKA